MTGCYEHKIDDKGRLSIPSDLRGELGEVFHITVLNENCITAFPKESWDKFLDKVKAMPILKQSRARPFFANAASCELDKQGRFLLSQKLRDRAGLKKEVSVIGMGTVVQIWDTEEFNRINELETTPENLAAVMEELEI